jgi:ATP-binding cassette subfamily C (CFTR/MRP) protein 1
MATTLSQPYLINAMIKFTQARDDASNRNSGYGLVAAFALNYTLLAIASSWCSQSVARFATKLRGCLISLIYEKVLYIASQDVDLDSATVLM